MDALRARELLEQELERLREVEHIVVREHVEATSDDEGTGELSAHDQHQADAASEVFEREKELSLLERVRLDLRDVDDALARILRGEFGRCQSCGAVIPDDRLEAMPATRFCIDHQSYWEAVRMTITPPPGPMPGRAPRGVSIDQLTELTALLNMDLLSHDDEVEDEVTLSPEEAALHFGGPDATQPGSRAERIQDAEAHHDAEEADGRAAGERADEEWTHDLDEVLAEEERLGPRG